jgi:hypothetical protein
MSRCTSCETCVKWYHPVPFDGSQYVHNDEPIAFSKKPCEMPKCEEWRAGQRHIIHTYHRPNGVGTHREVCVDCYLKFHGVFEE